VTQLIPAIANCSGVTGRSIRLFHSSKLVHEYQI